MTYGDGIKELKGSQADADVRRKLEAFKDNPIALKSMRALYDAIPLEYLQLYLTQHAHHEATSISRTANDYDKMFYCIARYNDAQINPQAILDWIAAARAKYLLKEEGNDSSGGIGSGTAEAGHEG